MAHCTDDYILAVIQIAIWLREFCIVSHMSNIGGAGPKQRYSRFTSPPTFVKVLDHNLHILNCLFHFTFCK